MTPYQAHRMNWKNCRLCNLCERRSRVVLARGVVPCDVLFIGEAPGVSEDVIGLPFVGPAGKLLDRIVEEAVEIAGKDPRRAFTNIIACIPNDEDGNKVTEPPKYAIQACEQRLIDFVRLCKPKLLILIGKIAQKTIYGQAQFSIQEDHGLEWLQDNTKDYLEIVYLVHPAALLRMDVSQQGLQIQRAVATLADAFEEL